MLFAALEVKITPPNESPTSGSVNREANNEVTVAPEIESASSRTELKKTGVVSEVITGGSVTGIIVILPVKLVDSLAAVVADKLRVLVVSTKLSAVFL